MNIRTNKGSCDTTEQGTLRIQSPTNATASLGGDEYTVLLQRSGGGRSGQIESDKDSPGCSYFCTSGADFKGTFVQRSRAQFFGEDIESCYATTSRAQTAVCDNPILDADTAKFLARCDASGDVSTCLGATFNEAIQH